eukprot:5404159-Ditylum_brightwellii.AAC.1
MSKCELKDPKKASAWRKLRLPEEILNYLNVNTLMKNLVSYNSYFSNTAKLKFYNQLVGIEIVRKVWKGKVAAWRESTTMSPSG